MVKKVISYAVPGLVAVYAVEWVQTTEMYTKPKSDKETSDEKASRNKTQRYLAGAAGAALAAFAMAALHKG